MLILDHHQKMSSTATHIFFLKGPFSQWDESHFRARLPAIDGLCAQSDEMAFNCCEQFMMAGKAHLFGDHDTLSEIMAVQPVPGARFYDVPDAQKKLGRKVKGFVPAIWEAHDVTIVTAGNMAKFQQSQRHFDALASTKGKILVEGAHYDKIWGVGLAWNDPRIEDPANWQGLNKLGKVVQHVRDVIC